MLQVHKTNLNETLIVSPSIREIFDGEVQLRIKKFALTTNNITYGVVGHKIGYWNFFPVDEPYGVIPVWGFAEVIDSKCADVRIGECYYGFYPMAETLVVTPGKSNPFGFVDTKEHRQALPKIYNFYSKQSSKASDGDDLIPLLKPLFATSFLNYHFVKENNLFDAAQVVITSASSKTGLGIASMFKKYAADHNVQIIGLTSSRNIDFVFSSGYYDSVLSYENYSNLKSQKTVIIDMAGNSSLLSQISDYLKDDIQHISLIGITDWQATKEFKTLPNSSFFFAPTHAASKSNSWGPEVLNTRIDESLTGFMNEMKNQININRISNWNELKDLYLTMLGGQVDPKKGYIFNSI